MRLDRIYTGVGDKGRTCLGTGQKVSKASLRIEAYGAVDELNAWLGLIAVDAHKDDGSWVDELSDIQNMLFDIGGELSMPSRVEAQTLNSEDISLLERKMDEMNKDLPPLQNFVLPGGHQRNAQLHVARTVCRRAERQVVKLGVEEPVRDEVLIFLNRLSDWLFVASRMCCVSRGVEENLWRQRKR